MILRRLVDNLKQQHWTSVGIELVIVVVGVFIGMQASNWNQDRAMNQQSGIFTARLKADLREEAWAYQFLIAYNREVLLNANQAISTLEGKSTLSDEALLVSAYRATQYKQRARRRSTYDELISTGTIGLIRDQTLRDTAMRLYGTYAFDNLVQEGLGSRYREAFRTGLPNDTQRALARRCGDLYIRPGDYVAIHGIINYQCTTALSGQDIAESAKWLRTNPNVIPYLRLRIADLETRLVDLTSNNRDIVESLRAIAMERP